MVAYVRTLSKQKAIYVRRTPTTKHMQQQHQAPLSIHTDQ
jgi:hypothetical protein